MRRQSFIGWIWEEVDRVFFSEGRAFFIYAHNYAGSWLEFHFIAHTLAGWLVVLIRPDEVDVA